MGAGCCSTGSSGSDCQEAWRCSRLSLIAWINRKVEDRKLSGKLSVGRAKAYDTIRSKGLLSKLSVLNFPSYLVKTRHVFIGERSRRNSNATQLRAAASESVYWRVKLSPLCYFTGNKRHAYTFSWRQDNTVCAWHSFCLANGGFSSIIWKSMSADWRLATAFKDCY
jgi:hypothetical protein